MAKILYLVLFLFVSGNVFGQYKYTGKHYTSGSTIAADEIPYLKTSFKNYGHGFRIYRKLDRKLVITDIDFLFRARQEDTIEVPDDFSMHSTTDCAPTQTYDVLLGPDRLLTFNRRTKEVYFAHNDTLNFRNVLPINDSTVLLYVYANYHPGDGFSGLQMHLLDLARIKIINTYTSRIKGIALSHMTVNWAVTAGPYIYSVSPLSGELTTYDRHFKIVDKKLLPIPWANYSGNLKYEAYTDSVVYTEYDRLKKIYDALGRDSVRKNRSLIRSELYSKDFFANTSQTVRKDYEFIEKAIPFSDSIIILTLSRPGYALKYRDVLFYNTRSAKIVRSIPKWSCAKKDTLSRFEDFFNVDVINDAHAAPVFVKDKVYYSTVYNIDLYQNGNADTVKKAMIKDVNKNNYTWRLLEYSY